MPSTHLSHVKVKGLREGGRVEKTSRCSRSHRSRFHRSHAPVLAHVPGSQGHAARGPLTGGSKKKGLRLRCCAPPEVPRDFRDFGWRVAV